MNNATRIILTTLATTMCATMQAAPLSLDISSLSNAWAEAEISAYKCRSAFKDFGKAVAEANAEAKTARAKLSMTARIYLKSQMEKAQAAGDLEKVMVFKNALESVRGGEIKGDDEAIVKLRKSYEKQLVLADRTLVAAGLTAARALTGTLEWQKTEVTQKGDITDAQKIVTFQKEVEEWMKAKQGKTATYCVIDLSAGSMASSYPITYLTSPPSGGFNVDTYKTTKLVLRRIEPGTFFMGDQRQITLTQPYYIGIFEITQKQYELVMGGNPSQYKGDKRPVERVSYNTIRGIKLGAQWPSSSAVDPDSFMGRLRMKTRLKFDLPTEAQWEYACRAGTTSKYNNGGNEESDLKQVGRYKGNHGDGKGDYSEAHTTVGSYQPNAWGLYDMHGNVWELCLDWKGDLTGPQTDPKGPLSGTKRVWRGGGFQAVDSICRSSYRDQWFPETASHILGFRLVRVLAR